MNIETMVAISENSYRIVMVVDGQVVETTLHDDEELVPLDNYNDFYKPIRVDGEWAEGATQAEIDALQPPPAGPTPDERIALLEADNLAMMMALVEVYQQLVELQLQTTEVAE